MIQEINNIEVIDAEICAGTCEVCECEPIPIYKDSDKIEFEASYWHETFTSVAAYYIKGITAASWSNRSWFSKTDCEFEKIEDGKHTSITIKAPVWYLKKLKIKIEKLTLIK